MSGAKIARRAPVAFARQRGMAVLAVSVIMLFLITVMTFYANKGAVLEQKMSANQLQYQQAYEAAQGGVDYSLAWLASASGVNVASAVAGMPLPANSPYPGTPYNQKNSTAIASNAIAIPNYTVTVTLMRHSLKPTVIEIDVTSTGPTSSTGSFPSATIKQTVNVKSLAGANTLTPLISSGCPVLSGSASAGAVSVGGISTSATTSAASGCSTNNMSGNINYNGAFPGGSAWNYAFGMSQSDMLALASAQTGGPTAGPIFYYTAATAPAGPWHPGTIGTAANPVIIIFDSTTTCPQINGGVNITGIVYCRPPTNGAMNGWGNVTITGSLITDGVAPNFTGSPTFSPIPGGGNPVYNPPPVVSKVTGAWRDF